MSEEIINTEEKITSENKKEDSELFPPIHIKESDDHIENYNNINKVEYDNYIMNQNEMFGIEDEDYNNFYKDQYDYLKDDENIEEPNNNKLFGGKMYEPCQSSSSEEDIEDDNDFQEYYSRKFHKKNQIEARVKLYKLNNKGNWIDTCTGFVSIIMNVKCPLLKVVEEKTNKLIIKIRIKDFIYTLQDNTILMWKSNNKEDNSNNDTALSFQNKQNLIDICDLIVTLYGHDRVTVIGLFETLNYISVNNLENILKVISENNNVESISKMIDKIIAVDFFKKMYEVLLSEENRIIQEIDNEKNKNESTNKNVDDDNMPSTSCESNNDNSYEGISNKKKILEEKLKSIKQINFVQSCQEEKEIENEGCQEKKENCYSVNQDNALINKEQCLGDSCEFINLKLIFLIYKHLLSFGNHQLIELMMNDSNYFGTFAALECKFF